ncbi:O-antigen ligase family protein [Candidatus Daviesbacteria bacterium]|nr:O-antigen ligase family protein [Candidatus Daviesbacteria bacterium]
MDNSLIIDLKKLINTYFALIFKIGLIVVILSVLFLFTNLLSETYDTPKFLVLLVVTGILLVLLTLKFTLTSKVVFIKTPLDIPLLLLLAVGIVSTILSSSPYISLLGNQLKIHGSLISLTVYILFYFLLVNNLKGFKKIKWVFNILIPASQILAAITLVSYAGIKILPAPWTTGTNFTTTGSSFSTTAILALLIPFMVTEILNSKKPLLTILNSLFLTLSGVTIALTGTWATWTTALAGVALTLFANNTRSLSSFKPLSLIGIVTPLVITALITVLSFIPPMGSAKNPIYTQAQSFPREIQLGFQDSWKISVSAFRDTPFWGTGPATYLFDFTNYKPAEFNSSKFWNLRFDWAFNEYLQVLATLGGIGLVALLSITALFFSSAYKTISKPHQLPDSELHLPLAISGILFFIILALHASTLSLWVIGVLILASFMVNNISEGLQNSWSKISDFKSLLSRVASNVTTVNSSEETIKVEALPGVLLTIALALVLFTFFFGGKFALADYHHRLALNAVSQNQGIVAYNELVAAEKLNPYSDLYRTDLAQTNFALANAIAAAKGPTEASPAGSLTDQDKQNIQVLLQQSINEGRTAVALSPKSASNWEILALLYRQIAGVAQNALIFSLDSYGRAILQDPTNPLLRVNVGGVYYAVKNYDMAIRFFTDAVNLKPDFANGYYNLSVALKDKGDLASAQVAAEKLLTLVEKESADYKTVNDYLNDLKNKTSSESTQQPPAAQTTGALQEEDLPKVIDLPKPEKIATPEAVKKPEATSEPTASPTSSPEATP